MKSIKLNFAAIAFLLGTGVAVASTAQKANVKWGFNGTSYEVAGEDYGCEPSDKICTRTYPEGQNPNVNPEGYLSQQLGNFAQ
ncbi:DUF6520 family protein [Pedobacter miscanthi]|uniref:DUF6520 family protein n=1 Tax=Pedobacter miscanthi TaxID=2259170 RepID=UPI002931433D|nr:DUF6520 family protein [Pedobacter miscanthi]